jgi:hypothetical protein
LVPLVIIYSLGCNSTEPQINYDENVILVEAINIDEWANDYVKIISASIQNDMLELQVQYGGGCKEHFFKLIISEGIEKSNPPQTTFFLSHNANGDSCKALISEDLRFNIIEYKQYLLNAFNTSTIIIKFYESDIRVFYFF